MTRRVPICKSCHRASCWQLVHPCREPSMTPYLMGPDFAEMGHELAVYFSEDYVAMGEQARRDKGLSTADDARRKGTT